MPVLLRALLQVLVPSTLFMAAGFMVAPSVAPGLPARPPIPAQFREVNLFAEAINQASSTPAISGTITGLIVPHHLLAVDLMAEVFSTARLANPELVLVVSPDHFNLGVSPVTVADRDFNTVFGLLKTNQTLAKKLTKNYPITRGDFFYREHGIGAVAPFVKYMFPNAKMLAMVVKDNITPEELNQLVAQLKNTLPKKTVIIQSTDFSHYLPEPAAEAMDAKTLSILTAGTAAEVLTLQQPEHIDSRAALYMQTRLQAELFGAKIKIVAHRNSQFYTSTLVKETTSYITAIFRKE